MVAGGHHSLAQVARELDVRPEMDRALYASQGRGNCWDNAPLESFFATLEKELLQGATFATRRQARAAIFDYVEGFYNRRRLHSALGYLSPAQYEARAV